MASNPPAQCCTVGVKHEGTPTGKLETIASTEAYVATPEKAHSSTAILLCTDVIGHTFANVQLIADQYAANGYLTVVPDLFQGDPVPLNKPAGFDLWAWLGGTSPSGQAHGLTQVDPVVAATLKYLREDKGIKRVGAVGYCFGAKYVVRFMEQGKGIDVGFVAHPSFVDEEELAKLAGPLSIAAAETDAIFPAEKRHKSEEILQKTGQPYQINLYSGTEHGFAVRSDISKAVTRFAKEAAFMQAVAWFNQWLKE